MNMSQAPGRDCKEGMSLIDMFNMFPDEDTANKWFESVAWNAGRVCGHCGSDHTSTVKSGKPMPYWCTSCRSYFSVKTGTPLQKSKVPMQKWGIAIYLCLTSLKSVSSMKLHRDIKVSQPTAWFMLHRLREAWMEDDDYAFGAPLKLTKPVLTASDPICPTASMKS
ncbi:MAG: IS1 family transposase [Gammaproteobacteria bacterium]|nr:IS1 family transposase [Gammaproteobacteria bacterium]